MLYWAIFVATVGFFQTLVAVRSVKQTDRRVHHGDFFPLSCNKSAEECTNDSKSGLATESVLVHWKNTEVFFQSCPCKTVSQKDWRVLGEERDQFPRVMTNSSGGLIGGTCTGGLITLCFLLYLLYRLLRRDTRPRPDSPPEMIIHVKQADTGNQDGASPRSPNAPCSPPPYPGLPSPAWSAEPVCFS